MPRIVPLQLLRCLKVLLDDNGGILSICEVKRIAGLMTKYSKKLVSKCIYVQILKVTKTELLGEFMAVGGWSLVYNWLNDAIRAMNWPLVQEILELLLLCPVDVERLKINSAPKLVKGLCKDGGNEGVRILAKRLVEQWLKVVTENTTTTVSDSAAPAQGAAMIPESAAVPAIAPVAQETKSSTIESQQMTKTKIQAAMSVDDDSVEEDPLADVADVPPEPASYTLTPAQKKANQAGLVYKIIYKDGQQVLAKVPKNMDAAPAVAEEEEEDDEEPANVAGDESESADADEQDEVEGGGAVDDEEVADATLVEEDDTRTSMDKPEKGSESSDEEHPQTVDDSSKSASERKLSIDSKLVEVDKEKTEKKESKISKDTRDEKSQDKERKSEKEKEKEKDKERKSSSSSAHKSSSSSSHKSKSSSSSSSSKTKSSSSSSSHRSSSDKHRSDKDKNKSSSSSNKDRSSSSSSSKHKSSSSKSSTSSTSSSSSSKERHRDKDKEKSSTALSSKKDKEREKEVQAEKDKDTLAKMTPPSLDKLGKIPKKTKEDSEVEVATSITIPSKKASMSIEIRRDSEKAKTVKTYKSQFRSHGLTEEAPPPPSRKGLKKPNSTASAPGFVIPMSLPSSIKRASPPPSDSPTQKKPKIIDINNVSGINEKPGAIKLIAPKKIQTLVETNIFSDALSAATGPKKSAKRKRPALPSSGQSKEGPSPPTSPDAPKVAPLKFYQDTLDESKTEERSDKENDAKENNKTVDDAAADKENSTEDDDDIPLKKVKEDIEQKVLREQKAASESSAIEIISDGEEVTKDEAKDEEEQEPKKPGPGCGPNGPPGVLMLHRRKGPKKKLSWRPQEHLEQIRYFELDETERVNVTKTTSFMDMKNMERFSERDAINIARRGLQYEDNMKPQIPWCTLIELDDVPPHPNGSQSRQRKVQADREMTTLRALYFSHAMIPDSPAEAELEPHFAHDVPVIPLDDITGNPDAVNDFTSMPWPEPKGSPKYGDNNTLVGAGGLSSLSAPTDIYSTVAATPNANPTNAFSRFMNPFGNAPPNNLAAQVPMAPNGPPAGWHGNLPNGGAPMAAIMGNQFYNGPMPTSPNMEINGAPPNYMGQYGPNVQFMPSGPQFAPQNYNPPPNYGPLIHAGPMMMDNLGPRPNNRNMNNNVGGGGNWRTGPNFADAKSMNVGSGGGGGGGNWRPAGSGPNRMPGGGGGGGGGGNINNGVCKAFIRGHCRMGKSCKFIHPKNKRI